MINIKDKNIYRSDHSTISDSWFLFNLVRDCIPNSKLALDGSLYRKQLIINYGYVFLDRKGNSSIKVVLLLAIIVILEVFFKINQDYSTIR